MSKILFITTQTIIPADGVSKKVFGQVQAIRNLGHEVQFIYPKQGVDSIDLYLNDEKFIRNMYNTSHYNHLADYIKHNRIEIVFIRYVVMASPRFLLFLKHISKYVDKILIEIPTYPYDGEFKSSSLSTFIFKYKEKLCRQLLYKWVDYVLTYANDKFIYNIPCIHISNAPAFRLPIKEEKDLSYPIKMIAVANIAPWHGYDRLINGFVEYCKKDNHYDVQLIIVGGGDEYTIESLKSIVANNNLQDCILFSGPKDGKELDELFDDADLAIGSLGRHRNGIRQLKTLKNVEYAMRGIPFVYSENNDDFDDKPYIIKVPDDDSPINIEVLVKFVQENKMRPIDISFSVRDMTWENQFNKVFSSIFK